MKSLRVYNLVKCMECGLVFRNPLPAATDINKFYETKYSLIFKEQEVNKHRLNIYENFLNKIAKTNKEGRLLDVGCGYGDFTIKSQTGINQ
jgi:ubiquinone/menaquinone biosynthesis C-methylase UbiE